MHGFEYSAACSMILNGLEAEGLRCVRAVRERYDGTRRNPWNEIECGGHYARSMAAWSLVMAYQGLSVNMTDNSAAFNKISAAENHASIWAFSGAWGRIESGNGKLIFICFGGSVNLKKFTFSGSENITAADYNGSAVSFTVNENQIIFGSPLNMKKGDILTISV
jgi:hypothetical protein